MALGRSLLCGGALLLCLTGCASMQNTVAQDLAWERWRKCDQLNTGVRLKEIRTNGDVWVEYSGSSQFANWNECMRRAQQEQAATSGITTVRDTARTAAIVPAVAVASPQPADAMSVPPLWKPGDEWAYRYERAHQATVPTSGRLIEKTQSTGSHTT